MVRNKSYEISLSDLVKHFELFSDKCKLSVSVFLRTWELFF